MMTQRPLKFLFKFNGNPLPEFPTFPHTEDEIYGNTAESQAKFKVFYCGKRNDWKISPPESLRHFYSGFEYNNLYHNRIVFFCKTGRYYLWKQIIDCFVVVACSVHQVSIHYEIMMQKGI